MSHRASTAWSALAVTLAIQAVTSMAALTVPVVAPALAESLHVSPTLIGAYTTILYMGSMLGSVLAGSLVVRHGPIRASQLGLLLCAIGLALPAMAPGLASTAIAAWLLGMGVGPITPASSHLLARTTPPQHASLVFSIKQSGAPLGGAMAGLFVPALLLIGGVNATLLAVAAGNLACVLIAQPMRAELDGDRRASHPLTFNGLVGPIRLVVLHHGLARLTSFAFVFSAVQMCLATYLVTYLHTGLGYSLVAAGATFAAAQVGGVVGRVAWGFFADRCLGARRMLTLLAAAMSICCVAAAALQAGAPIPVVMGLMIAFGASATGWNGVYFAELARLAPAGQASAATGGSLAIAFLGAVLGPMLFGALSGVFDSYRVGFAALALPTALCFWQLVRMGRSAPPSASR